MAQVSSLEGVAADWRQVEVEGVMAHLHYCCWRLVVVEAQNQEVVHRNRVVVVEENQSSVKVVVLESSLDLSGKCHCLVSLWRVELVKQK